MPELDIQKIRSDFPILSREVYKKPLVYFDNGATTHKPLAVTEKLTEIHNFTNSSIHRGVHYLSNQMTEEYEIARETVREFINARDKAEIVFTSGTTGSVNLLAFSFGEKYIREGDEIIVSEMEHHSNFVPWQMLCERKNAKLRIIPFDDNGELILDEYKQLFNEKTRLVSIVHVSNSLGTVNPVKEIIEIAHKNDVPVMVDGAQAVQHGSVDVQDLDADFYAFSGHKVFGPNGIGVFYGKEKFLDKLPPYQGGGDMVDCVTIEKTTYNILPFKFEAGTANYTGAVGLSEALKYVKKCGIENIVEHEHKLLQYATEKLEDIPGLKIYGKAKKKIPVFSFLLDSIHPYDAGMILDKTGVAVRTGTHCTQPVMDRFQITGTIRASMAMYNTLEEVDILVNSLNRVKEMLG
ncbi:MAG: aminotransferase class V-fold PLP-dependent enzyme [Bacteroidales bacterium]